MSAVTATLEIGKDTPAVILAMLENLHEGSRVSLTITELPAAGQVPALADYRHRIAEARRRAPLCPWADSKEAMQFLREGEAD